MKCQGCGKETVRKQHVVGHVPIMYLLWFTNDQTLVVETKERIKNMYDKEVKEKY